MNRFDQQYWQSRWNEGQTGWDVGQPSDPFLPFIDSIGDKDIRILIPGGGNGYEAEHLWKKGFHNLYLLDIVEQPLKNFKDRNPDFPKNQLLCQDFFELTMNFDLVLEHTFYCALDPALRDDYVKKMYEIIHPGGKLIGLLFNFPLTEEGPPFGGSEEEYRKRFDGFFRIDILEPCYVSIKPRLGRELWFEMTRK